ncbi:MAG: YciI-like protein [Ignavibacteriaceae bacterium]|nr:YciI-like protein [Ignavibacteriaceae bacterium]
MNYYVLIYHYIDDYMTRRGQFREEHLKLANASNQRGEMILAGAFSDPPDKALLIFHVADKSIIEEFIKNDPYVNNGLVTKWEIRPWTVVIGN